MKQVCDGWCRSRSDQVKAHRHSKRFSGCSLEQMPSGWGEVRLAVERGSSVIKEGAVMILSTQQLPPRANVRPRTRSLALKQRL